MTASRPALRVPTAYGNVVGFRKDGVVNFRGIPYAAPPFGERRFTSPEPPTPWEGDRTAETDGPAAPQPNTAPFGGDSMPAPEPTWGTDCLSLNVTTADLGQSGLPVMVYIHGGSYAVGNGSDRMARTVALASEGAVCVSINHRLGIDGFLAVPGAETNLGIRDQLEALRWVQQNIRQFGGDPTQVTVFGISAGAGAIAALASAAAKEGLLHRVILQSAPLRLVYEEAEARDVARRVLDDMEVSAGLDRYDLQELLSRQKGMHERYRDSALWHPYSYRLTPFNPMVDNDVVLTSSLQEMIPESVDLIVGCTNDEGRPFIELTGLMASADEAELAVAQDHFDVPQACRSAAATIDADQPVGVRLANLVSDQMYRGPVVELALGHALRGGRTYTYDFAWTAQPEGGAWHGADLPFVLDLFDDPVVGPMMGPDAPRELGDLMRRAWVSFARSGDPGWPCYDEKDRITMVFDKNSSARRDPREERRAAWDAAATSDQRTSWVGKDLA